MTRFHGNRFNKIGNIASARIRSESNKLQEVYDSSFVRPRIVGNWGNDKLICDMNFRVLEVECQSKIEYNGYDSPRCWLISPVFEYPQHIYKDSGCLCLYDPKNNEWTSSSHLYNTFVPWCIEWVIFQMLYEKTGEWQHPERHPGTMSDSEIQLFCRKHGIQYNEKIKDLIRENRN